MASIEINEVEFYEACTQLERKKIYEQIRENNLEEFLEECDVTQMEIMDEFLHDSYHDYGKLDNDFVEDERLTNDDFESNLRTLNSSYCQMSAEDQETIELLAKKYS
jgi:hypothetical protein